MNRADMKLLAFALTLLAASPVTCFGQASAAASAITGDWTGSATAHAQPVPLHLRIGGEAAGLTAALINGPESSPASNVAFSGNHLLITFNYYARTLDATLGADGKLTGSFGTATVRYPVTLAPGAPAAVGGEPSREVLGDWEVAVHSAKGESAWQLHLEPLAAGAGTGANVRAVIQRIDGDTGSLYGTCTAGECVVSHLTAAGPALYRFQLQGGSTNGETLLVSNLLRADLKADQQQNLLALRPAAARAAHLPPPTPSTGQTTMKDPNARLPFSAPDLTGRVVSNTDPQFDGKVVIVAVGGSWCPNCHDEAPVLEALYKQFHAKGLEIVNLSFEEQDQLKDPVRLRAFIARYGIDYTVLLAGTTEQLNEKIPGAENLNSWPTSFIVGRDGRVREIHAGFAGPANPPAHQALVREMTELIGELVSEPVPAQNAAVGRVR